MPRRCALLAPALLLAGCGPSQREIAGAVLLYAPLTYLLALFLVYPLFSAWERVRPDLRFGGASHLVGLLVSGGLAVIGGMYADPELGGLVLWLEGTCLLAWWLILARWTLRTGWGFRWGGLVTTAIITAPMLLALVAAPGQRHGLVEPVIALCIFLGGLGTTPLLLLLFMLIEASRARRAALLADASDPSATPGAGDDELPT